MQTASGAADARKAPRFGLLLGLLALVAFALREHFVLTTIVEAPIRGDVREYVACAWNLVTHGVFSSTLPPNMPVADSYRLPGYPWLIALAMKLFPQDPAWTSIGPWYPFVVQVQVVLGALTAVLVALTARQWLSATWSIAAGLMLALWPHHVAATNTLLSEVLFGFMLMLAMFAFTRAWSTHRIAWWVLAGAAFGYAYLVNPLILFFPPCLAVLAFLHRRRTPAIVLLLVFLLPVVAMSVRNAGLDPAVSRGSAQRASLNFVQGSWPNYHAAANRYRERDPVAVAIIDEIAAEDAALHEDLPSGLARMWARMARSPAFHAKWYLSKPWVLWGWQIRFGASDIYFDAVRNSPLDRNPVLRGIVVLYRDLNPWLTTITLACALLLLLRGLRRDADLPQSAVGALVTYLTLLHFVLQSEPRYATAYRGFEALLVMTALAWGCGWLRRHRARATNPAGREGT